MNHTTNTALSAMQRSAGPLLEVKHLQVDFAADSRTAVHAVTDASFTVYPGQWVAIVGESGSGKSTSAMSVLGLLPGTGSVVDGSITFQGKDITHAQDSDFVELRGTSLGLVPQDPMSNLDPVWRIGEQVKEALVANHMDVSHEKRSALVSELVGEEVRIKNKDDETFLGSQQREELLQAARAALAELKLPDAEQEAAMARFERDWIPGSETRWRIADAMIRAGIDDERAWRIAHKHVTGSAMNDRIAGLLDEAGLPDAATRARQYPHEFSGGMRQRALIAMALASRPDLLIADEPTSALDVTVQKKILDHLQSLTEDLGTAVLFITHDLGLAAERAQHIVVMYKGHVVESGPSLEVLQHPQHAYTKRLVAAAPSLASQRIVSQHASVLEHEREREESVQAALGDGARGSVNASVNENVSNSVSVSTSSDAHTADAPAPLLRVSHLTRTFRLPHTQELFKAVNDVSFTLQAGTTLAIVGESGSGKSTVANMVLRLLQPTSGSIEYEGEDTAAFSGKQLLDFRHRVQPVFQNPYGSFDPMYSIYRSLEEPLKIHHIGTRKERAARIRELVDMVKLPESVINRYPHELSGGQRQRIAIARAMALNPRLIVCDEAVSALDVLVQDQVLHLLNDLQAEQGLSYLFITHDLAVVRQIADEVVVMQHGNLVEHASTSEVFAHPQTQYTRDLLDAIPGAKLTLGLNIH